MPSSLHLTYHVAIRTFLTVLLIRIILLFRSLKSNVNLILSFLSHRVQILCATSGGIFSSKLQVKCHCIPFSLTTSDRRELENYKKRYPAYIYFVKNNPRLILKEVENKAYQFRYFGCFSKDIFWEVLSVRVMHLKVSH